MSERDRFELSANALRWRCDPELFRFESTAEVTPLQEFVGQDRALRAIEFGLSIDRPGYNIFVTGLSGTGRTSAIKSFLQRTVVSKQAADGSQVCDWCYVHHFDDADHPLPLRLPRGRGSALRSQMEALVRDLRSSITSSFANESYDNLRQKVIGVAQEKMQRLWSEVEQTARREGFLLQMSPTDVGLIPLIDDKPATQEQVLTLSEEEQTGLQKRHAQLMELVGEAMKKAHQLQHEGQEQLAQLDKSVTSMAVAGPFQQIEAACKDLPDVLDYVERVKGYTLENLHLFAKATGSQEGQGPQPLQLPLSMVEDPMRAYRVNVFVDNSRTSGAPIVVEYNPSFANLFGRIERRAVMGAMVTDHTLLKPGSLALANGGYLVTNARDLFTAPGVWDGLKRALRSKQLRLEEGVEALGLVAPSGLKPQPIPLELKVILLGDSQLYRLASLGDEEFWEMFKVKAEFDQEIDRTDERAHVYASFIATTCEADKLLHFDRGGVAAAIEHGARMVSDQNRLSTRFGQIRDLLVEADFYARAEGSPTVAARHVRRAVEEKALRVNLVQERIRQMITDGIILVDVEGTAVGQVNGLAVYDLGDLAFGQPSRITARTFAGRTGVVNIERESQLSGKTHDKGVLILTGFLGSRFAQGQPLSVSISLCFEQSYEGIDGDSASSTELYAILSSLSGQAIDQSLAVTGSVNQNGEIQAIGGVNEKVEGYYDVCLAKGLTGKQGVMIPKANARHLMLRPDIVDAVAAGKFHVYAVGSVAEGIELLTGVPLGEPDGAGVYPEGTLGKRVGERLAELAKAVRGTDKEREGEGETGAKPCRGDGCGKG